MIFENADALKDWLTSTLEPLCDADPSALAKYVMALIKKDKTEKDLKNLCLEQLEVFLQDKTISFVDTLFETISNKSYLKSSNSESSQVTSTNTNTPSSQSNELTSLDTAHAVSGESNTSTQRNDANHEREGKSRRNRSRSRTRSRSPGYRSSTNRTRNDRRGVGQAQSRSGASNRDGYFPDDRRNRRGNRGGGSGVSGGRRMGNNRYGDRERDREYQGVRRRGNDLKRGRSRSRSWSSTSSRSKSRTPPPRRSRSRSKSREREKTNKDSPSSKRSRPSSKSPSPSTGTKGDNKDQSMVNEKRKRCIDFDTKGFCMRGDECPYDHGVDPMVFDCNMMPTPATSGHALMQPSFPPPNTSNPNINLLEPYNPEAPAIESHHPPLRRAGPGPPNFMRPPFFGMHAPHAHMPPRPFPGPPPGPPMGFGNFPPHGRQRELIGVQTVDNNGHAGMQSHGHVHQHGQNRTVMEPITHMRDMRGRGRGGRGGRGGYKHVRKVAYDSEEKTCLEVRKIPIEMNTISKLNEHYSKFGQIVNLHVKHENDPEAALVQFQRHNEALAAIRSPEPLFNNRFIKVFWHYKEQQQAHEESNPTVAGGGAGGGSEQSEQGNPQDGSQQSKLSIKERLGARVDENNSENVVTSVSAAGTISRTVYDLSKLKKNNQSSVGQSNVGAHTHGQGHGQEKMKLRQGKQGGNRELVEQRQAYIKKKLEFLNNYLEQHKQLTDKLKKAKDEKERQTIMKMIEDYSAKIKELNKEVEKETEECKKLSASLVTPQPQTKEELQAELLNTDLELHNKLQSNDPSYFEDLKKVNLLKKKIKTLAMSARGGWRGGSGAGRRPRGGRGGLGVTQTAHKVDRRPRKLLIPDVQEDDTTDLLEHLAQFSDVECIEPSSSGAIVTFKTRDDAELASKQIGNIKFKKDSQLSFVWFDENKVKSKNNFALSCLTSTKETEMSTNIENEQAAQEVKTTSVTPLETLEDEEAEETEDDESEARNWKG